MNSSGINVMGLFGKKKPVLSDSQIQKWFRSEEALIQPFILSSVLLEGSLSDAGLDTHQKAVFNSLIMLGVLEQLNETGFNGELPKDLITGSLHEHLIEPPFEFDKKTASRIVFAADRGREKYRSYAELRFRGTQRVNPVISATNESTDDSAGALLRAWNIEEFYSDSDLITEFMSEYRKI